MVLFILVIDIILKLFRFKRPKAVGIVKILNGHLEVFNDLIANNVENGSAWIERGVFYLVDTITFKFTFEVLKVEGEDRAGLEGLDGQTVEPHTVTLHLLACTAVDLLELIFGLNVNRGVEWALFAVTNDKTKSLGLLTWQLGLVEYKTINTRGFYICKIIW